jgi:hypothetical protein
MKYYTLSFVFHSLVIFIKFQISSSFSNLNPKNKMFTSKGNATVSFVFKVSAEQAPAVEKGLADHANWMRETHAIGAGKSVNLVDYYVTKAE